MNGSLPPDEERDDGGERYRRARDWDQSRPSDATRAAILAHARLIAGADDAAHAAHEPELPPAANEAGWWRRGAAMAAVAALAGLLLVPYHRGRESGPELRVPGAATIEVQASSAPAAGNADVSSATTAPAPRAAAESASRADRPEVASDSQVAVAASDGRSAAPAVPSPQSPALAGAAVAPAPMAAYAPRMATSAAVAQAGRAPAESAPAAARAADAVARAAEPAVAGNAAGAIAHTPLMIAVMHRDAAAVELLLAQGADPNLADADGTTPLAAARRQQLMAIVTLLERAGAHAPP
jgi:hypothetical protein